MVVYDERQCENPEISHQIEHSTVNLPINLNSQQNPSKKYILNSQNNNSLPADTQQKIISSSDDNLYTKNDSEFDLNNENSIQIETLNFHYLFRQYDIQTEINKPFEDLNKLFSQQICKYNTIIGTLNCENLSTEKKIIKTHDDNFLSFLSKNFYFTKKLILLILNQGFDPKITVIISDLKNELEDEILVLQNKIYPNHNFGLLRKNTELMTNNASKSFCLFCNHKKKCQMFQLNFKYSYEYLNIFNELFFSAKKNTNRFEIFKFVEIMHQVIQKLETLNLNTFLLLFIKQRETLF